MQNLTSARRAVMLGEQIDTIEAALGKAKLIDRIGLLQRLEFYTGDKAALKDAVENSGDKATKDVLIGFSVHHFESVANTQLTPLIKQAMITALEEALAKKTAELKSMGFTK